MSWEKFDCLGVLSNHLKAMVQTKHIATVFRLVIDAVSRCAANDGSKWVCVPVEWEIGKFERLSQKPSTHS
jgi:hypothetical protein